MSSSSYASGTPLGSSSSPRDGNNNFMDGAENMLKLALKKPKAWKWELTTSSSSPGIDFPKIQLFDSRTGELMIQVDKPDCVVKSEQLEVGSERSRSSQGDGGKKSGKDQRYRRSRSSCIREKVATSGEYLSDVFEQLQNKGLGYKLATSASQYRVQEEEEEDRSLQKSKSANEVNGVKKKIRKSTSSRSSSILGRISEFYKSSTEEEPVVVSPPPPTPPPAIPEITVVEEPPAPEPPKNKIYKLVRSNAGTLIVREESFHTNRSLRRRKLESETTIPEDEPHTEQRVNLPVDIPTPSYDTTINEIDKLISKVMLSHTLQSVEEPPKHSSPVRIKQNEAKKRRSRRSASVGSAASRSASGGSRRGRKNSPRVTVLPGSSSSEEDAVSLAESRFGSLKRRGRPKYRRPAAAAAEENAVERSNGQETNGPSTGDQIIANSLQSSSSSPSPPPTVVLPSNNRDKCHRRRLHQTSSPDLIDVTGSGSAASRGDGKSSAPSIVSGCYKLHSQSSEEEGQAGKKKKQKKKNKTASSTTSASSSFLAASVAATDQVLLKLVQRLASLRSSNNNPKKKSKKKKHSTDSAGSGAGDTAQCKKPRCENQSGQSGNYHVIEAEEGEEDAALSGHPGAKVISAAGGGQIDCITYGGKREQVEEEEEEAAVDCDLVFCEVEKAAASGEIQAGGDDEIFPEEEIECVHGYCDGVGCDGLSFVVGIVKEEELRGRRQEQGVDAEEEGSCSMGANVSRHHEKGLTGRRAQSTDNLKSDQSSPYHQYNHYGGKNNNTVSSSNNNNNNNHPKQLKSVPPDLTPGEEFLGSGSGSGTEPDEQLLEQQQQQFLASNGINPHDRNKFCGSLPNHLDADDACEAIFKQNEFLQTHLKNVLASHQQQQPEYVTVASSGTSNVTGGGGGHQPMAGSSSSSQPPPYHQQSSPFYSSSSGKGSTISSTALGSSTFRSGSVSGGERPDIQLKLPLHRMCPSMDTGYDQGYGSERSPEDELPPPLLLMHEAQYNEILATSQLTQQPPASVIEPDDLQRFWNYEKAAASLIASGEYSFITKDSVFLVQVPKGTRGLGLSVSGGSDSSAPFPGLIRIKRLFPHQAAWATGMLQPGDILLEANGIPLTGLTNYEALEVLRTAPNYVTLTVCRPQDEQYRKLSPPSEPPRPPLRNPLSSEPASQLQSPQLSSCSSSSSNIAAAAATSNNNNLGQQQQLLHFQQMQQQLSQYNNNNSQQQMMPYYYPQQQQQQQYMFPPQTLAFAPASAADPSQSGFSGEFEIILTKQQGSLGFTLRKEDESVLGHYVRALVRDPALNDGRIRPGDKIVAVNDIPISSMTHEEAVIFLRQSAEVVKLRLYRDQAQTPLSAQSPTFGRRTTTTDGEESTPCHGTTKPKPNLRPEALNLLTDIAHRKQSATTTTASNSGGGSTSSSVKSSNASPRRLRRGLQGQNSKRSYDNHGFQETCSNYSDSETSTIVSHQQQQQQMVGVAIPGSGVYHSASCRSCRGAGTTVMSQQQQVQLSSLDDQYYCDEEIESLYDEEDEEGGDGAQKRRPNFLDLAGEGGSTPMSSRKPRFQFSVANTNAYELNNLDNEALDAPTMYALKGSTDPTVAASGSGSSDRDQFMSLPCETFLVACKTEQDLNADSTDAIYVKHFAHKSPLYSSVNVPLKENVSEVVDAVEKGGKKSLMKWKGATLTSDEDDESTASPAQHQSMDGSSPSLTGSSFPTSSTPDAESSLAATFGTTTGSTTTPTTERELDTANDDGGGLDGDGNKIFTVELNKGWNSRLGFSLKQDPDSRRPAISAIYSESVAAKDGRLRVGDQLLTVNDESVESMSTGQVIDLLRIIRGSICLRLVRIAVHPTIDADIILEEQQPNHSEQPECGENADQIEGETVQQ